MENAITAELWLVSIQEQMQAFHKLFSRAASLNTGTARRRRAADRQLAHFAVMELANSFHLAISQLTASASFGHACYFLA